MRLSSPLVEVQQIFEDRPITVGVGSEMNGQPAVFVHRVDRRARLEEEMYGVGLIALDVAVEKCIVVVVEFIEEIVASEQRLAFEKQPSLVQMIVVEQRHQSSELTGRLRRHTTSREGRMASVIDWHGE